MTNKPTPHITSSSPVLAIHFFYVVLILVAAIILLMTRSWTELKGFTDYLNVAATITSLVLGILAIIYSFVSNGSMSQFLGSIETSTSSMRAVSNDLQAISAGAKQLQQRADERTEQLQLLATELRHSITTLNDKTTAIAGTVETLPTRFGELREAVLARAPVGGLSADYGSELRAVWTEDFVKQFLQKSSRLGIAALRALERASESGKYCNLVKLFDTDDSKDFEYVYGFVIASASSGLILLDQPGPKANTRSPTRLKDPSDAFRRVLQSVWEARLQGEDKADREFFLKYEMAIPGCLQEPPPRKEN